jgi:hypothetical protein
MNRTTYTDVKPEQTALDDAASLELVFQKGMADSHRLPIDQVIRTLQEFQELVREVGRRVQTKNGVENPDGDFGLQLVGNRAGMIFRKGSLKAGAVATRDVANAKRTFNLITANVNAYTKKSVRPATIEDAIVARRLLRIGDLQKSSRTQIAIVTKGTEMASTKATLTEATWQHLRAAAQPHMKVEGLTLYGRLRQLNDRSKSEDTDGHFWGELAGEGQEVWRLRFPADRLGEVLPLFRQQVTVEGDATYFGFRHPRLIVKHIAKEPERDLVGAVTVLRSGAMKRFADFTTEELLAELHG